MNQETELALIPAVDVVEALSFDDWGRSSTLASLEGMQFMKCAFNGALLLGADSSSNLQL